MVSLDGDGRADFRHYAAHYYQQNGREEDAGTLLKEGAEANPGR